MKNPSRRRKLLAFAAPDFSAHACLWMLFFGVVTSSAELPPRAADALPGRAFAERIAGLSLPEREREIRAQFVAGNVPAFWRNFAGVKVTRRIDDEEHTALYRVAPEYLAIGSDEDFFLAPVTPLTAQTLADAVDCTLPTRRMVDDIYAAAAVKLAPSPLTPGPAMTTVPVFLEHHEIVSRQRALEKQPAGSLVAGHKKDLVLTPQLASAPGKVAIYGWHRLDGTAIQPLYLGHTDAWVDYSHGARFVQRRPQIAFRRTRPIGRCSVEIGDTQIDGLCHRAGPLGRAALDQQPPHRPATKADGRHAQISVSQRPIFHPRQVPARVLGPICKSGWSTKTFCGCAPSDAPANCHSFRAVPPMIQSVSDDARNVASCSR